MLPVESAFKVYTDLNGNPLDNGYVYFGLPNQNPITAPVTVYWDAAGTQPAAQPLRTVNGYIVRAGTPANVFIGSSYSQIVQTSTRQQVFYARNSDDFSIATTVMNFITSLASNIGASLIGFLQSGVGAVLTTVQAALRLYPSVTQWGVTGDGVTDDTVNFQKAIDAINARGGGRLLVPKATYALGKWYAKSNVCLILDPGTVLQAINNIFGVNDRFLNIDGVSNFTIEGNEAVIRMNKEYASGEQRHNVFMVDAHNITIRNLRSNDSGGDGFYIGRNAAGTHCTNIKLDNCKADNNRRNNYSIVSVDGCTLIAPEATNASGTAPQYGIDIEPNDSSDVMRGVVIMNPKTSGNVGGGIILALQQSVLTSGNDVSIRITGHVSNSDGNTVPNQGSAGLRIAGSSGSAWQNTLNGIITIEGVEILNPKASGLRCDNWDATRAPFVDIADVVVINPGSGSPAGNEDKCGLFVQAYDNGARNFGNIRVTNMRVHDTRGVVGTYSPAYLTRTTGASGVGQISNIQLRDVLGVGFTPTSGRGHLVAPVDMDQSSVTYTAEQTVSVIASNDPTVTRFYAGYTIVQTGGVVVGLPKASTNRGLSWRVRNTDGSTIQVRPDATAPDLIVEAIVAGRDLVLSNQWSEAEFRLGDSNLVETVYCNDLAKRPLNYAAPGRTVYRTAAPVADTWRVSDRCVNSAPAVGQPKAWVCTVAGTPGTWVSEGNL